LRLVLLFLALALLFALPFLLFGEVFEAALSGEAALRWLSDFGTFAWLAGLLLLASDLLLPVPASAVLTALGMLHGTFAGGAIGTLGLGLAGLLGWTVGRCCGRPVAARLFDPGEWAQAAALFTRFGGLLVAVSRALPLLPEVVGVAAGILGMRLPLFLAALLCGAAPVAFAFAAFGAASADRPLAGLLVSLAVPAALWFAIRPLFARLAVPASGAAHEALEREGPGETCGTGKRRPAGHRQKAAVQEADGGDQPDHRLRHVAGPAAGEQAQARGRRREESGPGQEPERVGEREPQPDQR
jgi:uncharacterized membrane protein YdjX (TVP38/TMEM64 family)